MSAYDRLDAKLRHIHALESISGLLEWDEQTLLPADSADQRQNQSAALAQVIHQAQADPEIGTLLDELETQNPEPETQNSADSIGPIIRDARKTYDRATRLPSSFVERHARLCSEAYHAWAKAREEDDFPSYAPYLQQHLDLAKERAEHLGWGDRPYDLQIELHDPGIDTETVDRLFTQLKTDLAPLAQEILSIPSKTAPDLFTGFPIDRQESFLKEVTTSLGFNYKRGRIDTSLHPFCAGNGADTRMTTRFDEDNPLDSLFSSIHETGHGLYEQGLPLDSLHNALGTAAGMGVHESQSRIWENQVCRSRTFWNHYEPKFRVAFPQRLASVSSEDLYQAINAVSRNPIRVDSDEVTYNLHIIIRFETERKLFSGELAIADLPAYWNAQYEELLDIHPTSNAQGVLQDVHWSGGAFGYFPSYTLGNMLAAQLWYAAQAQLPSLDADIGNGNFAPLLDWLRKKIHRHGARYHLLELTEKATGQTLSPTHLLRYLRERYLA